MISSLVHELTAARDDIVARSAGQVEFKGLDGVDELFRVAWAPRHRDAGPLREPTGASRIARYWSAASMALGPAAVVGRTSQDGPVDPLVRKRLEPRRLASGAVLGVVIGVPSILLLGSEGPKAVFYIGVALMVALTAPWIVSVLYLRTERGRAARDECLARQRQSRRH